MTQRKDPIQKAYQEMLIEKYLMTSVLMEDRIDFVKNLLKDKPISTDHDSTADHHTNDAIIDHLASHDPTKKKVYTQWMVNHYRKGAFKQEDAYRVGDRLSQFDSRKKEFADKDIAKYTPETLKNAVDLLPSEAPKTENELNREAEQKGRTKVFEDEKIKVYRLENTPEGKKASQNIYGGGSKIGGTHTEWCTADRRDDYCRFDNYSKDGALHVIHEKHPDKEDTVYQYHVSSNSFMDKDDNRISPEAFERIKPSLHDAWDKHPELLK